MINNLINRYPCLAQCREDIEKAVDAFEETYFSGGKILLCGNGGSAADCGHITGELMKGFRLKRPLEDDEKEALLQFDETGKKLSEKLQRAIPAISLVSQTELNSAFCNDADAEMVYAQGVFGLGNGGDLLVCISTSGNSENVVMAAVTAKAMGIKTVALTGKQDSKLSEICDVTIKAPETETYKVQELHLPIYHCICAKAEEDIFG